MLLGAVQDGLGLMMWREDSFAYADSYDEAAGRYRGLRVERMAVSEANLSGLLVRPAVAEKQMAAEAPPPGAVGASPGGTIVAPTPGGGPSGVVGGEQMVTPPPPLPQALPRRFHGSVTLDSTRVGRDAGKIAEEVIAHLAALAGAEVTVTLEIEAEVPSGAPDHVVRTVTENSRTLKFTSHGFEKE